MEFADAKDESSFYEVVTDTIGGCQICFRGITEASSITTRCGHTFCKSCFSSYVSVRVADHEIFPLRCPSSDCGEDVFGHAELVLEKESWRKLKRHRQHSELSVDAEVRWCPVINCPGYGRAKNGRAAICNECENEIPERGSEEIFSQFSVIACPRCRSYIARELGCMTGKCICGTRLCLKCGNECDDHHATWLCLVSDHDSNPSILIAAALVLTYVLLPFAPLLVLLWYRYCWDRNFWKVIDEHPLFYYFWVFMFSPILGPALLFWLPLLFGWMCVDCLMDGREKAYTGCWWWVFKVLVYVPAVFLSFIGLLLLAGLAVAFLPAYGIAVLVHEAFGRRRHKVQA
jgi:hypothetical protein